MVNVRLLQSESLKACRKPQMDTSGLWQLFVAQRITTGYGLFVLLRESIP
jgi:hypothetical protein